MTRPETKRISRKKPLGIGLLAVVILFILNLIGVAAIVASLTPLYDVVSKYLTANAINEVTDIARVYICEPLGISQIFGHYSVAQSAFALLSIAYEVLMITLLFLYFPFAVIGHNRRVNKKNKGALAVFQVLSILIILALLAFYVLTCLSQSPYSVKWFNDNLMTPFFDLFEKGGSLASLNFIDKFSLPLNALFCLTVAAYVVSLLLNLIGLIGKNLYYSNVYGISSTPSSRGDNRGGIEKQPEPYRQLDPLGRRVPAGYGAIKLAPIPSAEHIIVVEPGQKPVLPKSIAPVEPQKKIVPVAYVPGAERDMPKDEVKAPAPKPELTTVEAVEVKKEAPVQEVPVVEAETHVEEVQTVQEPVAETVAEPISIKTVPIPEPELVHEEKSIPAVIHEPAKPTPVKPAEEPAPVIPPQPPVVEKKEEERCWIQPTYREVKILNALEPIVKNDELTLPAIRETNVEAVLSNLEPFQSKPIENLPSEEAEIEEAADKANEIAPANAPVDYLPGIDDSLANPWEEEKPVEKTDVTEVAAPEPAKEPVVEEKAEEIVEEKAEEEIVPESTEPIHGTVIADKEPIVEEKTEETVEKEEAEEPAEEEKTVEEATEPEVIEEPEQKAIVTAINHVAEDDLRPQEEEHPDNEIATGPSRYDEKIVVNKNVLEETANTTLDEGWTIPGYEPAKEEVAQPAAEEKEIAPVEPAPIAEEEAAKRTFTLVDPMKHEAVEEKEEEKKELSAISGPLHQIRERKRDIQLVAPTRVKFDLKHYQIKTYQGELTPEEAFLKGVTKVQPVVNPVFANQPAADSWKQKKIDEENKKSGYFNVTQGKLVKPTRPISQKPTNTKITSIRDLVKARKAQEKAAAEEEKKDNE